MTRRVLPKGTATVALSTTGVASVEDLCTHLQRAIELEHSTLPPYLCALYSLDPTRNAEAAQVVGSVFAEEMLYLLLAANLLNAVCGSPVLDAPHLLLSYPHPLPHSDRSVWVGLASFGPEALELFLRIEQPARATPRRRQTATPRSASSTPRSRKDCVVCAPLSERGSCSAATAAVRSVTST